MWLGVWSLGFRVLGFKGFGLEAVWVGVWGQGPLTGPVYLDGAMPPFIWSVPQMTKASPFKLSAAVP